MSESISTQQPESIATSPVSDMVVVPCVLEPIAVIGMSCRLPGSAKDVDGYWDLLQNGRSAWTPAAPGNRFNMKQFQDSTGSISDSVYRKTNVAGAHFLSQDIRAFDASFFGLSPVEAAGMDPQHRLLLEVAYESFENASITLESLWGSKTGVYVGQWTTDYHEVATRDALRMPKYLVTGTGPAISSNRISYFFNLTGPSFTVDTGCSSSLVALHQAIHSLRSGEASQCFVGGVNLLLDPQRFVYQSKLSMFSKEGLCFSFDSRANGYGRGEGCTGMVLKPLSAALRDGDNVRAIIRNSVVNQDGRTQGLTVPSASAQTEAINRAYSQILMSPQADYVEAHGTGTRVGDPIEVSAIAAAFNSSVSDKKRSFQSSPMPIGSSKGNIGHTEAAAGLAGLIKAVLMLEKGMIPPQVNYAKTNPDIHLQEWNLRIPTQLEEKTLRRISVNSFGYGGTNAHVIVEHAASYISLLQSQSKSAVLSPDSVPFHSAVPVRRAFFLSAASELSSQMMCKRLLQYLIRAQPRMSDEQHMLAQLSYVLGKRSVFPYRVCILSSSLQELQQKLSFWGGTAVPRYEITWDIRNLHPRLAFVFSGQGAQYAQMGTELLQTNDRFRQAMERANRHLQHLGCNWDMLEELSKQEDESRIHEPAIAQPCCTAIQLALVDVLSDFSIYPTAVVGHSSGEIAAAYSARAISFEDAMAISYYRGKVTTELLADSSHQPGAMLAVGASPEVVEQQLLDMEKAALSTGYATIACYNAPESVSVSGDSATISQLKKRLDTHGYFCRILKTGGAAYHSRHMLAAEGPYMTFLKGLRPHPTEGSHDNHSNASFFSTVSGHILSDLQQLSMASYWTKNLLSPVLFAQGFSEMATHAFEGRNIDLAIELGPHSQLGGPVKQILKALGAAKTDQALPRYINCLARGKSSEETLLHALSSFHLHGVKVPLERLNRTAHLSTSACSALQDLPAYHFDHSRTFWHDSRISKNYTHRKHLPHELLGTLAPYSNYLEPQWRHIITLEQCPWLSHHVVQGQIVFPAAGYLTMAIQAILQHHKNVAPHTKVEKIVLRNFSIQKALLFMDDQPSVEVVVSLRPQPTSAHGSSSIWNEFRIFSVSQDEKWTEHCRGLGKISPKNDALAPVIPVKTISNTAKEANSVVSSDQFYSRSQQLGLHWQEYFRGLSEIRVDQSSSAATTEVLAEPTVGGVGDLIHPAALDSVLFQSHAALCFFGRGIDSALVPRFIKELEVHNKRITAGKSLLTSAVLNSDNWLSYDVAAHDMGKSVNTLIQARGITAVELPKEVSTQPEDVCFKVVWVPFGVWQAPVNIYDAVDKVASFCQWLGRQTPGLSVLITGSAATTIARRILQVSKRDDEAAVVKLVHLDINSSTQDEIDEMSAEIGLNTDIVLALRSPASTIETAVYDMVVTSDYVLQASGLRQSLTTWAHLLKSGGQLVAVASGRGCETATPQVMTIETWQSIVGEFGLSVPSMSVKSIENRLQPNKDASFFTSTRPWTTSTSVNPIVRILTANCNQHAEDAVHLQSMLPQLQISCHDLNEPYSSAEFVIILPDVARLISRNSDESIWQCFKLWLTKTPVVLFISVNSLDQSCDNSFYHGLWTGIARSIRQEYPHIRCVTLDLEPGDVFSKLALYLPLLYSPDLTPLFDHSQAPHEVENELAEVGGELHVSRIVKHHDAHDYISKMHQFSGPVMTPFLNRDSDLRRHLVAELGTPGLLETIRWKDSSLLSTSIGVDEVRVELRAASINFKDVLIAAGQLPGITQMRNDCSGIIVEVGANMEDRFKRGDQVMCLYSQSYANYPVVHGDCCEHMPKNLSFEEAASVPIVWTTVYYSLVEIGRLTKGSKILIHSAAGAVGQASIMLAQSIGAEIFATVGSDSKRDLLRERFGIPDDHIFSSRTSAFYSGILSITGNYGVDVVLNSLSGELVRYSQNLVATFGRFVEIGRKDLVEDSLMPTSFLLRNITYSYVDMALIIDVNKSLARRLLRNVASLLADGSIKPVMLTIRPISDIEGAFRLIQARKHVGKVILTVNQDSQQVKALPAIPPAAKFDEHASYAVVGGFGGIGRAVIEWMADNGAQNIVCITRSGAVTRNNIDFVNAMLARGVNLTTVQCDVSSAEQVTELARSLEEPGRHPIRGIIQSSVVFDDVLFEQMTAASWQRVLRPKVEGTKNLHNSFPELDFFIIMSSIIALCGNDGQVHYSAACCVQDDLARLRVAAGQHAFSINIGPVRDAGWLRDKTEVAKGVERRGFGSVSMTEVLSMVNYAMAYRPAADEPNNCLCTISPRPYSNMPAKKLEKRFCHISKMDKLGKGVSADTDPGSTWLSQLEAATTWDGATAIICDALLKQLGKLIDSPPASLSADHSLDHYGVDSLIAVEMRNWIVARLRADLSLMAIRATNSILELARRVAQESPLISSLKL